MALLVFVGFCAVVYGGAFWADLRARRRDSAVDEAARQASERDSRRHVAAMRASLEARGLVGIRRAP